jgi:hypothetical protein
MVANMSGVFAISATVFVGFFSFTYGRVEGVLERDLTIAEGVFLLLTFVLSAYVVWFMPQWMRVIADLDSTRRAAERLEAFVSRPLDVDHDSTCGIRSRGICDCDGSES